MTVSHRARRHVDRGGDPLDGLVNLFDLGIVLAVGFLIAGLGLAIDRQGRAVVPRMPSDGSDCSSSNTKSNGRHRIRTAHRTSNQPRGTSSF